MKQIILLLLHLSVLSIFSQYKISGKVIDSNNLPLENSNIVLINTTNNKIITGTTSNEKGEFNITLKKDYKSKLVIRFIGFQDWEKNLELDNSKIILGEIILKESINLNEVNIVARKKNNQEKSG